MEAETTNIVRSESSERSSLEVKPLSTSESIVIEEDDKAFLEAISVCGKCGENLCSKNSKFLSCLHTFCTPCVKQLEVVDANHIKCHTCGLQTHPTNILDNLFDLKPPPPAPEPAATSPDGGGGDNDANDCERKCMCCEDGVAATFFCVECSEWLCDQCTQAHKRVKLTKDHTLEARKSSNNKTTSENNNNNKNNKHDSNNKKLFMCGVHAAEELKLYCCTCGVMTCRDCQLLEHKDHQYQFIQEAAGLHREMMQGLLVKVREKQRYIENAKKLIEKRNNDITHKEELVINEMKLFSSSLIAQIHQQSMQLATDLQLIRETKRSQLSRKEMEISQLCSSLETGIGFCEHLLNVGDDKHLLHLHHLVMERLKAVLMTRCEVPNPNHVIDLRFKPNAVLSSALDKLGCLIVDGEPFNKPPHSEHPSSQPPQAPHKNKASVYNLINQPGGQSQQQQLNSLMSMLPDGKFSHWLKRQSDQRRPSSLQQQQQQQQHLQQHLQQQQHAQHQQQIQQQLHLQQLQQQQMQKMMSLLPPEEQAVHLPNQSGTITSSNTLKRHSFFHPSHQSQLPITIPQHSPHQQQHMQQQLHLQQKQQQQQQIQQQLMLQQQQQQQQAFPSTFPVPSFHSPSHLIHHHQQQQQQQQHLINLNLLQHERAKKQHHQQQQQQQQQPIVIEPTTIEPILLPHSFQDLQPVKRENHSQNHNHSGSGSGGRRSSGGKSTVSRSPTPRIESTTSLDYQGQHNDHSFDSFLDQWPFDELIASSDLSDDRTALRSSNRLRKRKLGAVDDDEGHALSVAAAEYHKKSSSPQLDKAYSGFSTSGKLSLDPSEDYCAVCNNGGELLCCDGCPKVFHLHCHVSQLSAAPSDKWFCGLCTPDDDLRLSAPDDDSGKNRHHKMDLSPNEEKVCKRLLLELYCDISSTPFHEAVSKTVHNYYKLIAHPIDMRAIRSKLGWHHFDHYTTPTLFVIDVLLLFANCAAFNPEDSEIAKAGRSLRSKFIDRCNDLLPYINVNHLLDSSPLLTNVTRAKTGSAHAISQKDAIDSSTVSTSLGSVGAADDDDDAGDDDGGGDDVEMVEDVKKSAGDGKRPARADDDDKVVGADCNDEETHSKRHNDDDDDDEANLDCKYLITGDDDMNGGEDDGDDEIKGVHDGGAADDVTGENNAEKIVNGKIGFLVGDDDDTLDNDDDENAHLINCSIENDDDISLGKKDAEVASEEKEGKMMKLKRGGDGAEGDGMKKKTMLSFEWSKNVLSGGDDDDGIIISQSNSKNNVKVRGKAWKVDTDACSHGNNDGPDDDEDNSIHCPASV